MGFLERPRQVVLLVAAALWLGCAHAPPLPPVDAPVWPRPPAAPLIRWAGSFPDDRFKPPAPSAFRRALDLIVGIETPRSEAQGLLQRPFGLAALARGFAVADPDGRAVMRVDWQRGSFEAVVCPANAWQMPMALAASPEGELYVADAGAGVVVRIGLDGGCTRIGAGGLERPTGVAFSAGLIFVVDPPRHQVVAFSPDGQVRFRVGERGHDEQGLNFPTGIAAALDGSLWVVDALNFRLIHLAADGRYLDQFGQPGDGEGAFGRPKAVALDPAGRLYVSDAQHDMVLMFASGAAFMLALGGTGSAPGQLLLPAGLAVGDGYLYVADSYNHRVEVFQLLGGDTP